MLQPPPTRGTFKRWRVSRGCVILEDPVPMGPVRQAGLHVGLSPDVRGADLLGPDTGDATDRGMLWRKCCPSYCCEMVSSALLVYPYEAVVYEIQVQYVGCM